MNKVIKTSIYCILILFFACDSTENRRLKNDNDKIILSRSYGTITILQDSLILRDSATCIKIAPVLASHKIVNAFVGCANNKKEYDVKTNGIKGCGERLVIENDTVKIYFTYKSKGEFEFEPVTLLLKDNNMQLSYVDTSFLVRVQ